MATELKTPSERRKPLGVQDMEQSLSRYSRRPVKTGPAGGSQTARSLLEENQYLSNLKKERQQLERQHSAELTDQIFARDKQNLEGDRSRQTKRRETHQALAQKYKS